MHLQLLQQTAAIQFIVDSEKYIFSCYLGSSLSYLGKYSKLRLSVRLLVLAAIVIVIVVAVLVCVACVHVVIRDFYAVFIVFMLFAA